MNPLLLDLRTAIADVLARHNCLDSLEAVVKAASAQVTQPVEDADFVARLCKAFNAVPVRA